MLYLDWRVASLLIAFSRLELLDSSWHLLSVHLLLLAIFDSSWSGSEITHLLLQQLAPPLPHSHHLAEELLPDQRHLSPPLLPRPPHCLTLSARHHRLLGTRAYQRLAS